MIGVTIDRVSKCFGETQALREVSLEIRPGEIFFLLGPSGCGKTTLLRAVAGFHFPDSGRIFFGDKEMTQVPAHLRETGMVFQNYALWPHRTVAENVAFGLEERKVPKKEIARRVEEALAAVRMEKVAGRGIHQLSGGQQQRVALARALVVRPQCLLLDEPLSNLDAKLRLEMRTEIRRICKESGLTAIYVTHDQKEALSIADRLAVFEAGEVRQVGTPEEVYRRPESRFVADFVGETNFLEGWIEAAEAGETYVVSFGDGLTRRVPAEGKRFAVGERVTVSVRPEGWRFGEEGLRGRVKESVYLGELAQYLFETGAGIVKVLELNPRRVLAPGEERLLTPESGEIVLLKS